MRMSYFCRAALLAGVAGCTLTAQNAHAQDADQAAVAAEDERDPGDIVVTANRREQRLQDVPISVQAVSQDQISARSITSIQGISSLAPGLTFTSGNSPGSSGFTMRGVGTAAFAAAGEQSVGLVFDGVPVGAAGAGLTAVVDVDHIDVLKGPQGTLFGRNASAGLVSVVSNAPDADAFAGRLFGSWATFNEFVVEGMLNLPLSDSTAIRVAANSTSRDGNIFNLSTNRFVNEESSSYFRGRFRSQLSEAVRVDLYAEYANRDVLCCQAGVTDRGTVTNYPVGMDISPFPRTIASEIDPFVRQQNWAYTGELNFDLGPATLTSLSAYRKYRTTNGGDIDQTPAAQVWATINDNQSQFSQELRLTSNGAQRIDYVFGALYYEADLTRFTDLQQPPVRLNLTNDVKWRDYAGFGQVTFHATDELDLVVGGRYTHSKVEAQFTQATVAPAFLAGVVVNPLRSGTADDFSYRGTIQYKISPDVMVYFTASSGYKGPAFADNGSAQMVLPETSTNYEVGLRSQFFDRRLTFNATLFTMKFKDLQVSVVDPSAGFASVLRNGGSLTSKGVELETRFKVDDNLTLTANATFMDAKYGTFNNVPCNSSLFTIGICTLVPGSFVPGVSAPVYVFNASGSQAVQAPKTTVVAGIDHNLPLGDSLALRTRVNFEYKSGHFLAIGDPLSYQPGYGILDATITLRDPDGRWEVSVFGRNLTDKAYTVQGGAGLLQFSRVTGAATINQGTNTKRLVPYSADRRFGASVSVSF